MTDHADPLRLGLFLLSAGLGVVFVALVALMLALKLLRRLADSRPAPAPPAAVPVEPEVSGVVMAAIATVLLLDQERLEEDEKLVLTLRALPKPYSNWWQSRLARAPWDPRFTPARPDVWHDPASGGGQS